MYEWNGTKIFDHFIMEKNLNCFLIKYLFKLSFVSK